MFYSSTIRSHNRSEGEKSTLSWAAVWTAVWNEASTGRGVHEESTVARGRSWNKTDPCHFIRRVIWGSLCKCTRVKLVRSLRGRDVCAVLAPHRVPSAPAGQQGPQAGCGSPGSCLAWGFITLCLGFFTHSVRGTKPFPSKSEDSPGLRRSSWVLESESTSPKCRAC